jgi:hypothetical protein
VSAGQAVQAVADEALNPVLQVTVFKAKAAVEVQTEPAGHAVQEVADEVLNPLLQTTEESKAKA